MRKDSWFRGALLSVLFFALLSGGAPTMVGASSPTSVQSAAGGCPSGYKLNARSGECYRDQSFNEAMDEGCESVNRFVDSGAADIIFGSTIAGGAAGALGKLWFGASMGPVGLSTVGIGALGWGLTRVARGLCRATGRG